MFRDRRHSIEVDNRSGNPTGSNRRSSRTDFDIRARQEAEARRTDGEQQPGESYYDTVQRLQREGSLPLTREQHDQKQYTGDQKEEEEYIDKHINEVGKNYVENPRPYVRHREISPEEVMRRARADQTYQVSHQDTSQQSQKVDPAILEVRNRMSKYDNFQLRRALKDE
jgi:hypothetical protein